MTNNEKVLTLDLNSLTEDEIAWLHELRNICTKIKWSRQLREMKEARNK